MHLKQPGFTYSACVPFIKNKEKIEKFMNTGNTDLIYRNDLHKACFQHDVAFVKSKGLARRLNQINFWEIKRLKLQVIQHMMVIQEE